MRIHIVYITYNRLHYTRLSLPKLLEDPSEKFELTVWDNGSTDGTVEYLKKNISDPRIKDFVFSKRNVGQVAAVNSVWSSSQAELLGKADNDCLVTAGWTRILSKAHEDIDKLGVVACWHFFPDDFHYNLAQHKIKKFGRHMIFRHPHTCGTGLLIKKRTFLKLGLLKGNSTTAYWHKMARAGYINGFYYPLIYQEHMDDPKSSHSTLKDEKSYLKAKDITFGLGSRGLETLSERWIWRQKILRSLHYDSYNIRFYRLKRAFKRMKNILKLLCPFCKPA